MSAATRLLTAVSLILACSSCSSDHMFVRDSDEVVNSLGDLTASLDEMLLAAGQNSPTFEIFHGAHEEDSELTGPERLSCLSTLPISNLACSTGVKTWNLNGECSFGLRTAVSGAVAFRFSSSTCDFTQVDQSISRQANTVMMGKKLGTLTTTSTESGQTLTRTAAGYTFQVNDLRRLFEWPDYSTDPMNVSTPTAWLVTGTSRSDRVIESGEIQAVHPNFGWTARLTITSPLRQASSCNCPISGKLAGTITGAESDDQFEIEFTGCGTARMSEHGLHSLNVKLDRCQPINY